MARLLLVSNRLPVTVRLEHRQVAVTPSVGGLATGLKGPHERSGGLWIGWPGDVGRLGPKEREALESQLADLRTVPVYLTPTELRRYYEGFSNEALWPLFHYLLDKVQLDGRDWETYQKVNARFAATVAEHYQPGDHIWIHDYHLTLVPGMLRQRFPEARIGFFLHIPFPSSEIFRTLPWREEILRGLLGADLVGFHTFAYLRHFASSLLRVVGAETEVDRVTYRGREIRLGVFPIGIDAQAFAEKSCEPEVLKKVEKMRADAAGRSLLLGLDRLDYTKGIPLRLLAVERLLEREPSLRRKVRVIQVATPSRTSIRAYEEVRREAEELVGRINGTYGTVGSVPIHLLTQTFTFPQLVPLYRAADVMLVTPIRDGMNLVAKEFLASRTDEDGVLLLSEFAGAASELGEALRVNPYDVGQVAATIRRALTMPVDERRTRMRALRPRVMTHDIHRWAESFLEALESQPREDSLRTVAVSKPEALSRLVTELRDAERLMLLLGYDGTLVPFAESPALAVPDRALRKLLSELGARPRTEVHVISARSPETLERWLGDLPIGLHAEHGLWSRMAPGDSWEAEREIPPDWADLVRPVLDEVTARTPGSFLEEKTGSIGWHYRSAEAEFGEVQAKELRQHLAEVLHHTPIEVITGRKVIELRLHGFHKGLVATRLLAGRNHPGAVLAMGDDRTDEDLFAALPPGSFAVHVGPIRSETPYRVPDPQAARELLQALL